MKAAHMKQKIVIPALVGMMMIPGSAVYAADQKAEVYPVLPAAGIETVVTDCYETKVKENLQLYLVPTGEGEYLNMAFSNTGEEFTYIRSAPDENSDWIGKLYPDSAVRVLEYKDPVRRCAGIRSGRYIVPGRRCKVTCRGIRKRGCNGNS